MSEIYWATNPKVTKEQREKQTIDYLGEKPKQLCEKLPKESKVYQKPKSWITIEFDKGECFGKGEASEATLQTFENLQKDGINVIQSTHNGFCDWLISIVPELENLSHDKITSYNLNFVNKYVPKEYRQFVDENLLKKEIVWVTKIGQVHWKKLTKHEGKDWNDYTEERIVQEIFPQAKNKLDKTLTDGTNKKVNDISILKKGVPLGKRNESCFKLAHDYRKKGNTLDETLVLLSSWNNNNNNPLPLKEVKACINSVYSYETENIKKKGKYNKKDEEEEQPETSLIITEDNIVEQVYDGIKSKFCVYDKNTKEISYVDEWDGFIPIKAEEVDQKALHLPSCAKDYDSSEELDKIIFQFIHKWLDIDNKLIQFSLWNIKRSWVYERFHTLNYLRALGDTGQGKSRYLDVLGILHYKPIFTSGATTSAPIFRIIKKWKGSLIIDEADFQKSDATQDIIKIINQGYEQGKHIMRCDQNDATKIQFFDPYCPKVIATRNTFEDKATESRCITTVMKGTKRRDILFNLNDNFYEEALEIRNMLLKWRFDNYFKIDSNKVQPNNLGDLEPRVQQIVNSFLTLFAQDEKEIKIFEEYMLGYQSELIDERRNSFEGLIIEGIYNLMLDGVEYFNTTDIIQKANITNRKGEFVKGNTISKKLKSLGFKKSISKLIYGKTKRIIPKDHEHLEMLFKRYGFDITPITQITPITERGSVLENDDKMGKIGLKTENAALSNECNKRNTVINSFDIINANGKKFRRTLDHVFLPCVSCGTVNKKGWNIEDEQGKIYCDMCAIGVEEVV